MMEQVSLAATCITKSLFIYLLPHYYISLTESIPKKIPVKWRIQNQDNFYSKQESLGFAQLFLSLCFVYFFCILFLNVLVSPVCHIDMCVCLIYLLLLNWNTHCIDFVWIWKKQFTWPKKTFVFSLTGSSEAEAKQDALEKARDTLTVLVGFKSLPKCSTVKETENQVNTLLGTKDQKEVIYLDECILYKSSVELLFSDYTMESKHEKKKKENASHLSSRILGLLAVKPGKNHKQVRNKLMISF